MAISSRNTYGIPVPPNGPIDAQIAVVGEAAGETEVLRMQGFCNRTGQRFREWMSRAGIAPTSVRFTTVIKERPLNNKIGQFIELGRGAPRLTPEYIKYRDELKQDLLAMPNLNLVIAVGNIALYALTGINGISKYRGSVLESTLIPGLKIIPTLHPAYVEREKTKKGNGDFISPEDLAFLEVMIMSDLFKAKRESLFKEIRTPKLDITFDPSYPQVMDYIKMCHDLGLTRNAENWRDGHIGFDIECTANLITYFSLSPYENTGMSVPIYDGVKYRYAPAEMTNIFTELSKLLYDERVRKIGQNLSFDNWFCQSKLGIEIRNFDDTMIMQATLLPELELKLGVLCSLYTDFAYYKDDRKNLLKFSQQDQLYNAKDSIVLHPIGNRLMTMIEGRKWEHKYRSLMEILPSLTFMSLKGIPIDTNKRQKWIEELEEKAAERDALFKESVGLADINPRSPKQVKEALGITGSTNKIALKHLASKGNKSSQHLLNLRETEKLISTYTRMDVSDGRVHTFFNPTTTTMRLKSGKESEGTSVDVSGNLQNLTQSFRKIMKPDDGYMFIEGDLSQAESRMVAFLSDDPHMKGAFKSKIDIHKNTAALVCSRMENVKREIDSITEEERQRFGKTPGHSLNYGLGVNNFSWRYQIPIQLGRRIRDAYLAGYSRIPAWWQSIITELAMTGCCLTNALGYSVKLLGHHNDPRTQMKANAWKPQSGVASIINDRGLKFNWKNFPTTLVILNQVHDSIWWQVPVSAFDEVAECLIKIKASLEQQIKGTSEEFVIPVDFKAGFSFYKKEMLEFHVTDPKSTEEELRRVKDFYAGVKPS